MLLFATLFVLSYLLGSINFAIIICKMVGLTDPRESGSHNPGATNVLRIGGKKLAITVLIADALKGFLPVIIAKALGIEGFWLSMIYLSAVLGHIFPIYFQFKGGKGVATTLGGLLALDPLVGFMTLMIWALTAAIYRYSSLASIAAVSFSPFLLIWHQPAAVIPAIAVTAILIHQHRANITRLYEGKEPKLGKKSP